MGWAGRWTSVLKTSTGAARLPALDGFRGIFVTLVLLYHFGVTQLVGGWVGINHFFVFSGYLIARILLSERAKHGSIDVRAFYRRRAERLLPALLVLLAAVLVHSVVATSPGERHQTAGDTLASLFFVQNWRLVARGDAYFDMLGDPSPLRHLWTLGVEEQFYLIVPWLLMGLFVLLRGRWSRVLAVLVLSGLSVGWTIWLANGDSPDFNRLYYGTDTRAQALLAGVAVAVAFGRGADGELGPRLRLGVIHALGVVGTAISVLAFVVVGVNSAWLFTRGGIVIFTVGAVLMGLAAFDPRPMALTRWAGWPPFVLLGQMTYGLYLYHWPIRLWLGPHLDGLPKWAAVLVLLVVTIVVAFVSFRYLELPVITRGLRGLLPRLRRREELPTAMGIFAALAALALVVLVANPAATGPLGGTASAATAGPAPGAPSELVEGQPVRADGKPATVGVFGDSVGHYLSERFPQQTFPDARIVNVSVEGCDLIDAPITIVPGVDGQNREKCTQVKETWDATLEAQDADSLVVVLSPLLVMPHEVDGKQLDLDDATYRSMITDRLDSMVERAEAAEIEQVAVVNVPCRDIDESKVPAVVQLFGQSYPDVVAEYKDPKTLNALVAKWAVDKPEVDAIDMYGALCGDPQVTEVDGQPVFDDFLHFSPGATPAIWSWLLGQLSQTKQATQ